MPMAGAKAAFWLHGALTIGTPTRITHANRDAIATVLPEFHLTLRKGDNVVASGVGSDVPDSPALALAHLASVLASQAALAAACGGRGDHHGQTDRCLARRVWREVVERLQRASGRGPSLTFG